MKDFQTLVLKVLPLLKDKTWNTDKLNLKIEGYKPPITLNRYN